MFSFFIIYYLPIIILLIFYFLLDIGLTLVFPVITLVSTLLVRGAHVVSPLGRPFATLNNSRRTRLRRIYVLVVVKRKPTSIASLAPFFLPLGLTIAYPLCTSIVSRIARKTGTTSVSSISDVSQR